MNILENSEIINKENIKVCIEYVTKSNLEEKINIISKEYEEKFKKFKNFKEKLVIVTDFDFTLTKKYKENNSNILYSTWGVIEKTGVLSENALQKTKELFDKYYPLENDVTIDAEIREKFSKEWYMQALEVLIEEKLSKDDFEKMLKNSENNYYFRYGVLELFSLVIKYKIPLFIISAGIYDIIEKSFYYLLGIKLKEYDFIHLIANKFNYDSNNTLLSYNKSIIFPFNKGDILKDIFHKYHTNDSYIIVMGDHINDADAIKHIDYEEEIKIGFLNIIEDSLSIKQQKLKEIFTLKYDVLIENDGNLNFIIELIKQIKKRNDDIF